MLLGTGTAVAGEDCRSSAPSRPLLSADLGAAPKGELVELKGTVCGAATVELQFRNKRKWMSAGQVPVAPQGSFAGCARVRPASRRSRVARYRARTASGVSRVVRIKVIRTGSSPGCAAAAHGGGAPSPSSSPSADSSANPPPLPGAQPGDGSPCPLASLGSSIGLTLPGCTAVGSDTASAADPLSFWGSIECASASRHQWLPSDGDTHAEASGLPQADTGYRRLTVYDGDDFYGERCELGRNDHRYGPTAVYREGQRRATFFSVRLPDDFPLEVEAWQVVMQMKQAQPSANGGGTPVIELDAYDGRWRLLQSLSNGPSDDSRELWSAPATTGTWTRFGFDVTYSQDPSIGSIAVHVDLNGDGDDEDAGERSPAINTYTLKYETSGGPANDGITPGESIPSHLRAGIYHNPGIPCPSGCAVELDNVQVLAP